MIAYKVVFAILLTYAICWQLLNSDENNYKK